jgi:CRISPR system Cascade subunit CasB
MNQPSPPDTDTAEADDAGPISPGEAVGRAARMLHPETGSLPTGEQATIRRVSPDAPVTPALWKVLTHLGQHEAPDWISPARWERRWGTLLMGMAHCPGLHDYDTPLGEALATAGWSETRFVRLMEAGEETLPDLIRRMAQYLASKQQHANWDDVRRLLFYQSGETAEEIRLSIARSYYRTLYAEEEDG